MRLKTKRGIISNSSFPAPTEASLKAKPILPKTTQQAQEYFSKTVVEYQRACLAQIGDIGARK